MARSPFQTTYCLLGQANSEIHRKEYDGTLNTPKVIAFLARSPVHTLDQRGPKPYKEPGAVLGTRGINSKGDRVPTPTRFTFRQKTPQGSWFAYLTMSPAMRP